MISFKLRCSQHHEFEGWFRSSDDFAGQQARGLLSCPICDDSSIEKAVMAPAVARRDRDPAPAQRQEVLPPKSANDSPAPTPEMMAKMAAYLHQVKAHVEANFENVGNKFPEEARKIHYGEAEEREIFGKATLDDAKELIDEGIGVMPLPDLPKLDS